MAAKANAGMKTWQPVRKDFELVKAKNIMT